MRVPRREPMPPEEEEEPAVVAEEDPEAGEEDAVVADQDAEALQDAKSKEEILMFECAFCVWKFE